jgi:hypothetical protein
MPDDVIFNTACQQATVSESAQDEDELELFGKLTTADRQAIRDHARAAADAMGGAAAAIMERWPKLSGVDEVALQRAVADAWRIRAMADALEPKGHP